MSEIEEENNELVRAIIYGEYEKLLGKRQLAIVLSQMVYWQSRVKSFDKYQKMLNEKNIVSGYEISELQYGWIYKTGKQLSTEILALGDDACNKQLKKLVDLGYLFVRSNPRHKRDKTNQYLVNIQKVFVDLQDLGMGIPNWKYPVIIKKPTVGRIPTESESMTTTAESIPMDSDSLPTESGAIPETNIETKVKTIIKKSNVFIPPSVEEVIEYCNEKKFNIDPEYFFDHYETRGWILKGGAKIKDWKACIRTRVRNNYIEPKNNQPQNKSIEKKEEIVIFSDSRFSEEINKKLNMVFDSQKERGYPKTTVQKQMLCDELYDYCRSERGQIVLVDKMIKTGRMKVEEMFIEDLPKVFNTSNLEDWYDNFKEPLRDESQPNGRSITPQNKLIEEFGKVSGYRIRVGFTDPDNMYRAYPRENI